MCEQSEINYLDGDIVWVKLGSCWWPGEVVGTDKLPPDVLPSFRKPPIAVVKFFQEDTYEYVKNLNGIFKYNCSRKNEFINKGLYMYRTKHGHMEKFPEDVIRAETAVGGDSAILTRDEFQEAKKESYASLFGDPAKKNNTSVKKGKGAKGRSSDSPNLSTPMKKFKEKSNYKVHILLQGSKTPIQNETISTPSTSRAESEPSEVSPEKPSDKNDNQSESEEVEKPSSFNTPTMSSSGMYVCHACQFSTQRLNVLILHNKTHSISYTPYTPSPIKKKPINKSKSTPVSCKSPKQRKRRTEKSDKKEKKPNSHKRAAETEKTQEAKKPKTDEEIKSSLLADWDDGDEESADESSTMIMAGSPEVPIAAESPAVPTPAELPCAQMPVESDKKPDSPTQKPESSSDSKYEFCEDEDWSTETDIGRKIPFKSSSKRSGEKKSLSIDEEEMVREVAELLIKTTLPELPSAPEPLKVEENFPEGAIVKSPDKKQDKSQEESTPEKKTVNDNQPPKTIFKTKTFFRSRHSRSQDAIGKYVAEQLNAAERLDMSETELNGSEVASSPEIRDSPPVEQVKVARLAPKIQFKKIKAEAAQQREMEKYKAEKQKEESLGASKIDADTETPAPVEEKENSKMTISSLSLSNTEKVYKNKRNANIDKDSTQKHKNKETVNENSIVNVNDDSKIVKKDDSPVKNNTIIQEETTVEFKVSDSIPKPFEPFMNESTASAVDALLSVSREADRVTKVISDDPPEDLFEDDVKDNVSNVNGFSDTTPKNIEENLEKSLDSTEKTEDISPVSDVEIVNKLEKTDLSTNDVQSDVSLTTVPNAEDASEKIDEDENIPNNIKPDEINPELLLPAAENPLLVENIPSESDLQIAEALINLPTTTINNKVSVKNKKVKAVVKSDKITSNNDVTVQSCQNFSIEEDLDITPTQSKAIVTPTKDINARFETEQEKSENLIAAKSLVQMSESIDHTLKISEMKSSKEKLNISQLKDEEVKVSSTDTEQTLTVCTNDFNNETITHNISPNLHINSPKLLKILEEPGLPKLAPRKTVTKQIIVPRKEKILNVDVGKSPLKPKTQSPKQKIIIRRTTPSKNLLNNIGEITTPDKIILSRTNKSSQDGSSVQTYTIQTTPDIPNTTDPNTIIIQQKIRQVVKPVSKLQKIKPQSQTIVTTAKESKVIQSTKSKDDSMFDINSMPIVLTPESIEKMPIVMSDGNIITNSSNPPKLVKTKQTIAESEKIMAGSTKEIKPLIMSASNEMSKVTTPNILSKSSKLRGTKPMLVIDKTTGKQKIIMTKTESHKEVKQPPTLVQSAPSSTQKAEKFIILPTQSSPRPGRTQKIVINPQTGKAHVLVGKASEPQLSSTENNKPVSAKLIPSASDSSTPGNTVMIITNAQGAQSRIVLTPEHEKILFPNKQQPQMSQLKPITHRITSGTGAVQKPIITTASGTVTKTQTRIVPKQKSAIITSKGQLIVGGRIATTTQNIAPLPEIRPAPKRILASEPKKLVQTIQKNSSEPLIFLRQNSSAVMQLTVAQFEHLQRTGQIIQKAPTPVQENKIVVQKSVTITPKDTVPPLQKHRVRKQPNESPTPIKKLKHEIAIAPAPAPIAMPALTPIAPPQVQNVSSTTANISASNYSDLENLEELLPSTAIVRQTEPTLVQSEVPQPPPAALSDGQLLAVPGEHFGGPAGSFYLCVEDNGNYTAIDNRPLVLENNQLVPMPDPLPVLVPQPERRDILEAALANSDVFHGDTAREEPPDFRDLNANVSVHCRVSETSTTLNQPIMTPIEVPSKVQDTEPTVPSNIEDGLAVIGVTPHTVPTSLELPITVTDPRIAPKTTDPLRNNNYGPPLLPSPNTELFTTSEEDTETSMGLPISMPILTDDDDNVGKSMPILTDEVTERTVSSVESTIGSPSSIDVRESENEDSQWPRRLLTPCSDTSETSAEIPLQPVMQLSVNDLSHSS